MSIITNPAQDMSHIAIEITNQRGIYSVAFSPDSSTLASNLVLWCSHQMAQDLPVQPWRETFTCGTRKREVFHGAKALVFSPDNKTLINGDGNGRIQLWDITTGNEIITLNGHMEGVETLHFSPDGNTLVSAGQDGTILLWDWDEVINSAFEENQ